MTTIVAWLAALLVVAFITYNKGYQSGYQTATRDMERMCEDMNPNPKD